MLEYFDSDKEDSCGPSERAPPLHTAGPSRHRRSPTRVPSGVLSMDSMCIDPVGTRPGGANGSLECAQAHSCSRGQSAPQVHAHALSHSCSDAAMSEGCAMEATGEGAPWRPPPARDGVTWALETLLSDEAGSRESLKALQQVGRKPEIVMSSISGLKRCACACSMLLRSS